MSYDETKFDDFNKMLRESKAEGLQAVAVHHPSVLGDTYEELVENLNRLADAELMLVIVPRKKR